MTQSPSITLSLLSLSPPPLHPFLFSTVWTLPLKSVQMQWEERPEVQPYSPATPQGRTEQRALLTITNANPVAGPVGPNCQSPPSPVRLGDGCAGHTTKEKCLCPTALGSWSGVPHPHPALLRLQHSLPSAQESSLSFSRPSPGTMCRRAGTLPSISSEMVVSSYKEAH